MVRDAKTKGGETSLITRRRLTFSPVGISYVSNKTISPTKEELKKGENWEIVHNEEGKTLANSYPLKSIPIAKIISKG